MAHSLKCNNAYFVTGIGTDIGKTFLVENLCRALLQKQVAITAIKPVMSGFSDDDKNSDSARILSALGRDFSQENIDLITPWRFTAAASPHIAAKDQPIDFLAVLDFCKKNIATAKNQEQILLIEAAGGLMTPINDEKTFLDLAFELKIPVLLLSANYLGSISHTLCAAEVLKNKKILVEKIIINDDLLSLEKNSTIKTSAVIKTIENLSGISTISLNNFIELQ